MRQKKAFSLFELSVSLAIIGIVIAALTQGAKLITSSKLTAAKALTSSSPVKKIPGLIAWYETSLPESMLVNEERDEATISSWFDISPNSISEKKNRLTRTASNAVTFEKDGIGDIPSIEFNGTGNLTLSNFYQGISGQNTIFFVVRPFTLSGGQNIIDSRNGVVNTTTIALTTTGIFSFWGASANIAASNCCIPNKDYIVSFYANGTLSKAFINSANSMIGGTTFNPGTGRLGSLTGLTVGATSFNTSNLTGLVSEIIIFDRPLSDQHRVEIMTYLSKKFGIKIT